MYNSLIKNIHFMSNIKIIKVGKLIDGNGSSVDNGVIVGRIKSSKKSEVKKKLIKRI